jgi:membrane protein implicated in regulation of membrane protease activity
LNEGVLRFLAWLAIRGGAFVAGLSVIIGVLFLMIRAFAKPQGALGPDLVGASGTAVTDVSHSEGRVKVAGRTLIAVSEDPIPAGKPVTVVEIDGMVAKVKPA